MSAEQAMAAAIECLEQGRRIEDPAILSGLIDAWTWVTIAEALQAVSS